ncbi:MAG: hypothetical protein ABI980_10460, partial [Nitrospirota bacterium]
MTWTTEKPSKPGWYWYRSPADRPQVIELIEWNDELRAVGVSPACGQKTCPAFTPLRDNSNGRAPESFAAPNGLHRR